MAMEIAEYEFAAAIGAGLIPVAIVLENVFVGGSHGSRSLDAPETGHFFDEGGGGFAFAAQNVGFFVGLAA